MLPAEFEAREPLTAQRPPQIPFLVRLVTTKLAGGGDRIHTDRMQIAAKNSSRALLLPLLAKRGEGRGEEANLPKTLICIEICCRNSKRDETDFGLFFDI
jgi:hypothetical protein